MDETLFPAIRASRLAVPHMRDRGGGVIIMIASIWGRESGGRMTYNAVKAAQISLAKSMARELAPHNIRVNSVAPGDEIGEGLEIVALDQDVTDMEHRAYRVGRSGPISEVEPTGPTAHRGHVPDRQATRVAGGRHTGTGAAPRNPRRRVRLRAGPPSLHRSAGGQPVIARTTA